MESTNTRGKDESRPSLLHGSQNPPTLSLSLLPFREKNGMYEEPSSFDLVPIRYNEPFILP
jgi:hypothetical protein